MNFNSIVIVYDGTITVYKNFDSFGLRSPRKHLIGSLEISVSSLMEIMHNYIITRTQIELESWFNFFIFSFDSDRKLHMYSHHLPFDEASDEIKSGRFDHAQKMKQRCSVCWALTYRHTDRRT